MMSIVAYARSKGIDVQTVDGMVEGHCSLAQTFARIYDLVHRFGEPYLIGFSNINTFEEVRWLAQQCRAQWAGTSIVLGNTFATLNAERVLQDETFDFVIRGDGEVSFTLLAEAILNDREVHEIPGLAWRLPNGDVESSRPASVCLDELPWPARIELPTVLRHGFSGAVYTSRGCYYRCTFCGTGATSDLLGKGGFRFRSIDNVVDEIEYLIKDYNLKFISISDDLFLAKQRQTHERAHHLADEIIRRKLRLGFMFDARMDALNDLELLRHLKHAGLERIFVGLETGSEQQLSNYQKHYPMPTEDVVSQIREIGKLGIQIVPGTIMFHPEVTPSELRNTLTLLKATGYEAPRKLCDRITAYAGTPLHREYASKGYLVTDWPIGEWDFRDAGARRVYNQVSGHINQTESISFDQAARFFLSAVSDWEIATERSICD